MDWLFALMILGGGCFLLQKVSLPLKEYMWPRSEKWFWRFNVWGWGIFLIGLIPIVIYMSLLHDWIAASLELGGAPAMWMGFQSARKKDLHGKASPFADRFARVCIVVGIATSIYLLGTIATLAQFWELVMVSGYLIGTRELGKHKVVGYFWFYVMFLGCGSLMNIQHQWLMSWQQVASAIVTAPGLLMKFRQVQNAKRR